MGVALAEAVLQRGGVPVIVSGPVSLLYPDDAEIHHVETTEQMLERCEALFPDCDGVVGAAAPCDFKPVLFSEQKLTKADSGGEFLLRMEPTPDILAALGRIKRTDQWIVGFALETQNGREHALDKLRRKNCDFVVLNGPTSIGNDDASVEVFDALGRRAVALHGSKHRIAAELLALTKGIFS